MSDAPNDAQAPPPPPPAAAPPPPPAAPPPATAGGGGGGNRTAMLVLSYLWLLALIPFLVEKEDQEVRWHAKHGLVLLVAEFVLQIVLWVVSMVIGWVLGDVLGCLASLLFLLVYAAIIVLHVACIVKALKGERLLIPGVSEYADKI